MRLLLDTHALIWHRTGSDKMSKTARKIIAENPGQTFISIATVWEMSIKVGLGKLKLIRPISELLDIYHDAGTEILPITPEHAMASGCLPWHHRDPFGRMLIAQAQLEKMTIVTQDGWFTPYSVPCVW